MARTTAEFLTDLKIRITMPANQVLLTDDDILLRASTIMRVNMTKILKASRQNYMLTETEIPLVSDQRGYDVPYRSVVNGLEDLKYVCANNSGIRDLDYITVEDIDMYLRTNSVVAAWYFQGDQIIVVPVPEDETGVLRLWYHRQLSKLCQVSEAAQVTNISGNIVTVSNVPASFVAGTTYIDFIKSRSLSIILEQDRLITNIAGTQLTFNTDEVPTRLIPGDWIAPATFTPVLPMPDETYDYFEGLCGVDCLKAIGDYEGAQMLMQDVKDDEKDVMSLLEPRVDGEPEKIVNYHSLLRERTWRPFGYFRR